MSSRRLKSEPNPIKVRLKPDPTKDDQNPNRTPMWTVRGGWTADVRRDSGPVTEYSSISVAMFRML